jgi:hypothetical protein
MNKKDAKSFLKRVAPHCINITSHCKKSMAKRDVGALDILHVIMWGTVIEVKWDAEFENWNCKVTGKDIEKEDLTIILGICEDTNIVQCITVF